MRYHHAALIEELFRLGERGIGDDFHRRKEENSVSFAAQLEFLARHCHVVFENFVGNPVAVVERVLKAFADLLRR